MSHLQYFDFAGPDVGWSNSCNMKKAKGGGHANATHKPFRQAESICLGVGARVCTLGELLAGGELPL